MRGVCNNCDNERQGGLILKRTESFKWQNNSGSNHNEREGGLIILTRTESDKWQKSNSVGRTNRGNRRSVKRRNADKRK